MDAIGKKDGILLCWPPWLLLFTVAAALALQSVVSGFVILVQFAILDVVVDVIKETADDLKKAQKIIDDLQIEIEKIRMREKKIGK